MLPAMAALLEPSDGVPSHLMAQVGKDPLPSSLTWVLAGLISLQHVGLKDSSLPFLFPGGLSQFLATWEPFHMGACNMAPGFHQREQARKSEREHPG